MFHLEPPHAYRAVYILIREYPFQGRFPLHDSNNEYIHNKETQASISPQYKDIDCCYIDTCLYRYARVNRKKNIDIHIYILHTHIYIYIEYVHKYSSTLVPLKPFG